MRKLKKLFENPDFVGLLWIAIALVAGVSKLVSNTYRNFDVFTSVFHNAVQGLCLYEFNPDTSLLHNHYGIVFSFIIAPFTLAPEWLGMVLWLVVSAGVLFWAVRSLPVESWKKVFVLWFCINELYTAVANIQYNVLVAAFIVLAYVLVERKRDFWATLFIALGTFTKIYGAGALVFFLFSKNKKRFIASFAFWCTLLLVLPGVFYGFDYTIQCYRDWMTNLSLKSGQNMFSDYQNISLVGMVRKISGVASYPDLWVIVPALLIYLAPLVRFGQYKNRDFQLSTLASTLMFVVLFSNGSESSTYIIAFTGVATWYISSPTRLTAKWLNITLLVFVFVVSSLSPTDLFPTSLYRAYVLPYALKALPVAVVWFKLVGEMMVCDYGAVRNS